MRIVRLAYRDNDRTPVIYCIKAMAEQHYDVNVEVIQIEPQREVEAALFNDNCDAIIEHIEYLHSDAARDRKITFFVRRLFTSPLSATTVNKRSESFRR
jgi:hypothetical protein